MAYIRRLLALAPMQDWYAAALCESWRDVGHDDDVQRHAVVTADLRAS
jgi:glutathione S-transferase